jgi:hypothetical protein
MKALFKISLVTLLVLTLTSCAKDFAYIIGIDADAPISFTLHGSRYDWRGEMFKSDAGIFTHNNHPEIIIDDECGFELDLYRVLTTESGKAATLYFYLENLHSELEVGKVYSLTLLGKGRACVDFQEYGKTETLPSGTTVTDILTYCYRAIDGYIVFNSIEVYGGDCLISGEFEFTGMSEEGDQLELRNGKFKDCRVSVSKENLSSN